MVKPLSNLKPHQVIERSATEPVLRRVIGTTEWESCQPPFDWGLYEYTIGYIPAPIDWANVDWAFFNQYGGLWVCREGYEGKALLNSDQVTQLATIGKVDDLMLAESPYYPWFYEDFLPYPADRCNLHTVKRHDNTVAFKIIEVV